jgi:hypothetical protein
VENVASELLKGNIEVEAGKTRLVKTRKEVERGWKAIGDVLAQEGQREMATHVRRFVGSLPRTEKENLAIDLLSRMEQSRFHRRPSLGNEPSRT